MKRVKLYLLCLSLLRIYPHMLEAPLEDDWMEELGQTLKEHYSAIDEELFQYFSCELYMMDPPALQRKSVQYDPEKKVFIIREKDEDSFSLTTLSSTEDAGLPVKRETIQILDNSLLHRRIASRNVVFATGEHIEMIKLYGERMWLEEQAQEDLLNEAGKGQLVRALYRDTTNLARIREIYKNEEEACTMEWLADPDRPAELIPKEPLVQDKAQEQEARFWEKTEGGSVQRYNSVTREFLKYAREAAKSPAKESEEENHSEIDSEKFEKIEKELRDFLDYIQGESFNL